MSRNFLYVLSGHIWKIEKDINVLQNSVPAVRTNVRLRALKFHDIIISIEEQCERLCYYNRRIFYHIRSKGAVFINKE